jgi:hypothetical protein
MELPPLGYVASLAVILPSLVALSLYRRLPADLRPLFVLFGIHAAIMVAQFVLAHQRINNLWTSHWYYLIEVVMLLWLYSLWSRSQKALFIFRLLSVCYAVFWVAAKIFFEEFTATALYTPTVSRVILIGATLYVLGVLASTSEGPLYIEAKFWFAAGFLVLLAGSMMFYAFRTLFLDYSPDSVNLFWSIHWSVTIFSNLLHIIGFLCILRLPNIGGQSELAQ